MSEHKTCSCGRCIWRDPISLPLFQGWWTQGGALKERYPLDTWTGPYPTCPNSECGDLLKPQGKISPNPFKVQRDAAEAAVEKLLENDATPCVICPVYKCEDCPGIINIELSYSEAKEHCKKLRRKWAYADRKD